MSKSIRNSLLQQLNDLDIKLSDEGGLVLDDNVYAISLVLRSELEFSFDIPQEKQRDITWQIIKRIGTSGKKFTQENLLAENKILSHEYLSLPKKKYAALTTLSLHSPIRKRKISGNHISFSFNLPKGFHAVRASAEYSARPSLYTKSIPENYLYARINVESRCESSAMNEALNALDLLRGIWNLILNYRTRRHASHQQPVNSIVLGPIHTLHDPTGGIVMQGHWYEPFYLFQVKPLDGTKQDELFEREAAIRADLKRLPDEYRYHVERFIREYCRALDNTDLHKSYLELWAVLEMLTGCEESSNKDPVARALFFFSNNRDFHKEVLLGLRRIRNVVVHTNTEFQSVEWPLYQLKMYVESLIISHLQVGSNVRNIKEVFGIMDLPVCEKELEKKITQFTTAHKLLYPKQTN